MILEAIKETIKEDKSLEKFVDAYFKVTGDFSEKRLIEIYKTGANLGGTCIEDSLIIGIKNDEENYIKAKNILNKKIK